MNDKQNSDPFDTPNLGVARWAAPFIVVVAALVVTIILKLRAIKGWISDAY